MIAIDLRWSSVVIAADLRWSAIVIAFDLRWSIAIAFAFAIAVGVQFASCDFLDVANQATLFG